MKAKELDHRFGAGEDVSDQVVFEQARKPNHQQRVNVDFPVWMVQALDQEARRVGVTRQSIIKIWLAERLEQLEKK